MIIIQGQQAFPAAVRGGSVALGNFDGVHLGHQAVIGAARAKAQEKAIPLVVATFAPHPSKFFRPDSDPFSLTTIEQRLKLFEALGVDAAIVIPFDKQLAELSAEAFARNWLVEKIGATHVVTGEDFSFGKGRSGNAQILAELGVSLGFTTQALSAVEQRAEIVSSTRIRHALQSGDMATATELLTRPYTIEGPVVHGAKLGRTIGIPTANQQLGEYQRPRYGVYAVRVSLPDGQVAKGVANLGIRPMFDPPIELLETWILDWSGDLYGQTIRVELVEWLRPELKLNGLDDLKAQIARDAEQARQILA